MAERRPAGIRLIIAYKLVKSVLQAVAALLLVVWATPRHAAGVRHLVDVVDAHLAARWSVHVARLVTLVARPRALHLVAAAVGLDGIVSFVEGYCLWRGFTWAPWLVVAATATPLPLEIRELVRRPALGRAALVVINVAVVVYLAMRIARRHGPGGSGARRGAAGGQRTCDGGRT